MNNFILKVTRFCSSAMAPSYYAVRQGRRVGIYRTWSECESQVKGFSGAKYKKFGCEQEAEEFINQGSSCGHLSGYTPSIRVKKTHNFKVKSKVLGSYGTSKPSSKPSTRRTQLITQSELANDSSRNDSTIPVVYTDGCCLGNGKKRAIGGIGVYWGPEHPRNISEYLDVDKPTNQIAELQAAARAIESAKEMGLDSVEVRTDSTYTIKSMTEWLPRWERNGWKTSNNTDVSNKDIMIRLNHACKQVHVKWTHVRGHRGIHGNEEADRLANEGALGRGR